MVTHYRAPATPTRQIACLKQTPRPFSQSGTLNTSACVVLPPIQTTYTLRTGQLYLACSTKRIDVYLAHIRCVPSLFFRGKGTDRLCAHVGAFFAELADALAAPAFTHPLALYVGHDISLVRLLAGLGAVPLRWPAFGAEVVFEVRPPVWYPMFEYIFVPGVGGYWRALHTRVPRRHGAQRVGMGAVGRVCGSFKGPCAGSAL